MLQSKLENDVVLTGCHVFNYKDHEGNCQLHKIRQLVILTMIVLPLIQLRIRLLSSPCRLSVRFFPDDTDQIEIGRKSHIFCFLLIAIESGLSYNFE